MLRRRPPDPGDVPGGREFARLDGVRVPLTTESIARLKFAGRARMTVHYEYESINGRQVSMSARRTMASAAVGR